MSTLASSWDAYLAENPLADRPEVVFAAGWNAREAAIGPTLVMESTAFEIKPEDIYAAYPYKRSKVAGLIAIRKAIKRIGDDPTWKQVSHLSPESYLLNRTQLFAHAVSQWPESEMKYRPYPASWYNAGSYEDDESLWQKGKPVYVSQFSNSH